MLAHREEITETYIRAFFTLLLATELPAVLTHPVMERLT